MILIRICNFKKKFFWGLDMGQVLAKAGRRFTLWGIWEKQVPEKKYDICSIAPNFF
jgi:hypothetical protein